MSRLIECKLELKLCCCLFTRLPSGYRAAGQGLGSSLLECVVTYIQWPFVADCSFNAESTVSTVLSVVYCSLQELAAVFYAANKKTLQSCNPSQQASQYEGACVEQKQCQDPCGHQPRLAHLQTSLLTMASTFTVLPSARISNSLRLLSDVSLQSNSHVTTEGTRMRWQVKQCSPVPSCSVLLT